MKRILMFVLCAFLILGCVACSPSTPDQGQEPGDTTQPPKQENNQGEDVGGEDIEEPSKDKYSNYTSVSLRDIYINYKDGRRKTTLGAMEVFSGVETDMTLLAYDVKSGAFTGTAADAFALLNDGRMFVEISLLTNLNFHDRDTKYLIETKTTENVKVGELDMMRFTGSVTSTGGVVCYAYGYSFVMENTPCVVLGLVLTIEQEASLIESITAEVEAMIKTVRAKR